MANQREGVRVREGVPSISLNRFEANRFGLLGMDLPSGILAENVFAGNGETGLELRNTENLAVTRNSFSGNGLADMTLQDVRGRVADNLVTGTEELVNGFTIPQRDMPGAAGHALPPVASTAFPLRSSSP